MEIDWSDPKIFIPIIGGTASLIGAAISILNAVRSGKSLKIQVAQEARRQPNLAIYYDQGTTSRTAIERWYAIKVAIMNRSDTDTSLSRVELEIQYRTNEGFTTSVKIPSGTCDRQDVSALDIPLGIDSNQTVAGWICFAVPLEFLSDKSIDSYSLVATDVHGLRTSVEAVILEDSSNARQ